MWAVRLPVKRKSTNDSRIMRGGRRGSFPPDPDTPALAEVTALRRWFRSAMLGERGEEMRFRAKTPSTPRTAPRYSLRLGERESAGPHVNKLLLLATALLLASALDLQ